MNIATVLEEQARRWPDRPAIVEPERAVTFDDLNRRVAAAAGELSALGVSAGMRALVFSRMSIDLYVVLIALLRLRAAAVFVDPSAGRARLDVCVRRVRPDAFVAIPRAHWLRVTSSAIRGIRIQAAIRGRVPLAATVAANPGAAPHPVEPCDPSTPAIITFTSGSTGEPKAAVRTHGFLIAQHEALETSIALTPGETDLCTLPIFLLANLASGLTSVIPDADLRRPGQIAAPPVARQIAAAGVTRTVASPAFLARLVDHAQKSGRVLDTLRHVYTGGAPVFPATLDAIAAIAPRAEVVALYGSTEAEPIAEIERRRISQDDRAAMAAGAGLLAGPPVASIEVRILRDRWGEPLGPFGTGDFDRAAVRAGEVGEIVVRGAHVLTGYLDGRGDDETKIRVAGRIWHRTGDAGYLDDRGRLWLLGRCSARIDDARGRLYPFAVEAAASDVAGIARTAFVSHRGRRVLAVELGGVTDVPAELRSRLAWAHVDDFIVLDRIPVDRRHNAKVDYPGLLRALDRTADTSDR